MNGLRLLSATLLLVCSSVMAGPLPDKSPLSAELFTSEDYPANAVLLQSEIIEYFRDITIFATQKKRSKPTSSWSGTTVPVSGSEFVALRALCRETYYDLKDKKGLPKSIGNARVRIQLVDNRKVTQLDYLSADETAAFFRVVQCKLRSAHHGLSERAVQRVSVPLEEVLRRIDTDKGQHPCN